MRWFGFAVVLLLAQPAGAAELPAGNVSNGSLTQADGTRLLQHAITIDAPAEKIWAAFVDPKAIREWSAPMAVVDLRQGGYIEEEFTKEAKLGSPDNIRHKIISYLPGHLLVLQNETAPSGLPGGARFKDLVLIVEIESLDKQHTLVRLSQTGYGNDPEFNKLYAFFETHNPELLEALKRALENTKSAQAAAGVANVAR
ncbi:MAG: SRPBCC domain-containing protein [Alphaproteobacteria bacterium]|nr:SRPBCC domain-containing protein [Alphaproteobacteria bacterium]MBV9062933.1 SRPBCC domain-containing protein [Alphaproteobacteria bacterium]